VIRFLLALHLLFCPSLAGQKWEVAYFFDEEDQALRLTDFVFPSEKRGVAAGVLVNSRGKTEPVALVTSNGGARWDLVKLEETATSLSFIDDSRGWMAAGGGSIWRTEEGGRNWKKIASLKGVRTIWFLDENRGVAAGVPKAAWTTSDGGRTWKPIPQAAEPSADPQGVIYDVISFTGGMGLIGGAYEPQPAGRRRRDLPSWIEPEAAIARRQVPRLTLLLETLDGAATWKAQTAPVFGRLHGLSLAPDGTGLSLFRFTPGFEWPAEVHALNWKTGKSERVFREKNRVVTSVKSFGAAAQFLAGFEPPGRLWNAPVPGKVKILMSRDRTTWTEIPVDYRAVATRAILAGTSPENLWAATDTGMVLRLRP
jgi:hypothetical protein